MPQHTEQIILRDLIASNFSSFAVIHITQSTFKNILMAVKWKKNFKEEIFIENRKK